MTTKLQLNRRQLSEFLKDHQSIKQFEKLFDVATDADESLHYTLQNITSDTVITDYYTLNVVNASGGDIDITLPAISTEKLGYPIMINAINADNDITVYPNTGATIIGKSSIVTKRPYRTYLYRPATLTEWIIT